jgi:hypothetical protein
MIERTRPDWVIVGAPHRDGVMILASRELDQATLEAQIPEVHVYESRSGPLRQREVSPWYTLTVEMPRFVVVVGPDYPAVLRSLFEQWSPPPAGHRVVEARRALPFA